MMLESHTAFTISPKQNFIQIFPPPVTCGDNVAISGMHKQKKIMECDKNVAISGMCRLQGNVTKM